MESKLPSANPVELLVDSDFFIALYSSSDTNHQGALLLLEKIRKKEAGLLISVLVYSEIVTVLSQRVSQATARHFMEDSEMAGLHIAQTTEELFEKSKAIFKNQRSKNVSFTDASNIALARIKGFSSIVSFDRDYSKNGLPLLK